MKRVVQTPAPDLVIHQAIGAKRTKLDEDTGSKLESGKCSALRSHAPIISVQEHAAAQAQPAMQKDAEQHSSMPIGPATAAPDNQPPAGAQDDIIDPPPTHQPAEAKQESPTALQGAMPTTDEAVQGAVVAGEEQAKRLGYRVKLREVISNRLAAHDVLLRRCKRSVLGVGSFAVVAEGTAVPAAGTPSYLDQASSSSSLKPSAAAPLTTNKTAAGSQDSTAVAVKLYKLSIGDPNSAQHAFWNSPQGQAILQQDANQELQILKLLQGTTGVVQLLAVGELEAVGGNTAEVPVAVTEAAVAPDAGTEDDYLSLLDSTSAGQHPLCAVLEKHVQLDTFIAQKHPIPEFCIKMMIADIVEVLHIMHSGCLHSNGQHYKVVHRDLAIKNLLVSKEGIKLVDFGSAALVPVSKPLEPSSSAHDASSTAVYDSSNEDGSRVSLDTAVGSHLYLAPEVAALFEPSSLAGTSPISTYDCSVDMWSLGVVVLVLVGGGLWCMGKQKLIPPWTGEKPQHLQGLVTSFVNGHVLLGPMSANPQKDYAPLREFVNCCCGITKPRMSASEMMGAKMPGWLPKLKTEEQTSKPAPKLK